MNITYEILRSWACREGTVTSNDEILEWIKSRNETLKVNITKVPFSYDGFWYYDETDGMVRNRKNSFFQLSGYEEIEDGKTVNEQPVIIQDEIGYLGIICRKINGVWNFLMQAKIEPGNINVIQVSPTIQATKSNFTRAHGGKSPLYLEYFERSGQYPLILDQVQSEQSSRFYKKRNRNIMIYVDEEIPVEPSHRWMTLGQIKELMKYDNLVNMDSRTVLSGIPLRREDLSEEEYREVQELFNDKALCRSMFEGTDLTMEHILFNCVNNHKMLDNRKSRLKPLKELKDWDMTETEIVCRYPYDYKVVYCSIEIEGREVRFWDQPLVEANGIMVLGLFTSVMDGVRKFLVKVRHEPGCFDTAELSPSVQLEPSNPRTKLDSAEKLFLEKLERKDGVMKDVILSEEGGRFYHEQNRNVILEVRGEELPDLPKDYYWVDYRTLNTMIRFNNVMNIQLRNLLSILDL